MAIMSQRYLKTQYDMSISMLNYQCIICKKGSSHNGNNNICVVNLIEAENLISWYKACFLGVVANVFHEF
jgi:hypothetical protein